MDPIVGERATSHGIKRFLETVLESRAEGIYLNPRKNGDQSNSFKMIGHKMYRMDILDILKTYYNPKYRITSVKDNIVNLEVDAIVNSANKDLIGGSGMNGAIHKAAGPLLLEECKKLGGCETGEAKITEAYRLRAKKIIHTVGPVYSGKDLDKELLANCYRNSLELAKKSHLHTIAFPGISTGHSGYPLEKASSIAFDTAVDWLNRNPLVPIRIIFVK